MEQFSWWQSVVFPYVNFAIFIGVLIYFARGPLAKMVKQRCSDYEGLLAKAHEAQDLAAAQLADLEKRLASLDNELALIRQRMQSEAAHEAEEIKRKGEALRQYIQGEAERIRQAEVRRAGEKLQEQIVNLLGKNLRQEITENWHDGEQRAFNHQQAAELSKIVY